MHVRNNLWEKDNHMSEFIQIWALFLDAIYTRWDLSLDNLFIMQFQGLILVTAGIRFSVSLRSCPLPIIPLCLSREEGMIHFFVGSHVKKPESGLFSDWIGNNTDDLRCSDWPKCRHPLVVVDFSLHFCLRNEQWIHTRVRYEISVGSVFLNLKNA